MTQQSKHTKTLRPVFKYLRLNGMAEDAEGERATAVAELGLVGGDVDTSTFFVDPQPSVLKLNQPDSKPPPQNNGRAIYFFFMAFMALVTARALVLRATIMVKRSKSPMEACGEREREKEDRHEISVRKQEMRVGKHYGACSNKLIL